MTSLAPIALFAYNRPTHTRKVVEALQNNALAAQSDLFVFADGVKKPEHLAGVTEVREYLRSIGGFKSVTITERPENYGCPKSIITGVTEIVNRFGKIIVVEDDILTSPYFLKFMNEALALYRDEEQVISVLGYLYPMKAQLPETFFLKDNECWGWATWKRGWDLFEPDGCKLLAELERRKLTRKFDINGSYPFTQILRDHIKGRLSTWDIHWQASAFLHDKLTLYPGRSLVNNIGHDSSGEHCEETTCFDVEVSQTPIKIEKIPLLESAFALAQLESYFLSIRRTPVKRAARLLKKALRKVGLTRQRGRS